MGKVLVSMLALLIAACLQNQAVLAKAQMIAVFPVRSTTDLAPRAREAGQAIIDRLGSLQGFDARLVPAPASGSLGAAAAAAGAEFYVVGQLLRNDSGYQLMLGSFQAATDKPIGDLRLALASTTTFPDQPSISSLILAAQPSGGAAASTSDATTGVEVTAGLPLDVHLDAQLSSSSAKVGDTFSFQAANDVVASGLVVIQKGAQGQGEVMQAESAGGNGHSGKLAIQFDWIMSTDGSKIKMSVTPRSAEGEGKTGAASTATIASYVFLGPLGLFAHNFVKGKDITLEPTTKLTGYVEHTVHVKATQKADVATGFAH
jgi:hypothetical protein